MTWFAKELIFEATDAAWRAIQDNEIIRRNLYYLDGPIVHDWYKPEFQHAYPEQGLFIIRPICSSHMQAYEWLQGKDGVLEPSDIILSNDANLDIDLSNIAAVHALSEEQFDKEIPLQILHFAKQLSNEINQTIAYYDVCFWGGSVDYELSWLFGDNEQVLTRNCDIRTDIHIKGNTSHITSTNSGDILQDTLLKLGCFQPSGFFLPHTRAFSWSSYQVR